MNKTTINISLMLLVSIFMLIITELVLQQFPVPDPFAREKVLQKYRPRYIPSAHSRNFVYERENEKELKGVDPKSIFTTNSYGFRGDELRLPKPKSEYRIFTVGGSTTECFALNDNKDMSAILQENLQNNYESTIQIKVYNAGKSGDKSVDHLAMISQRMIHLKPDMIILFAGINDLTASIHNYDYLHYPSEEIQKVAFKRQLTRILTEFQLPRRLYILNKILNPDPDIETVTRKTNILGKASKRRSLPLLEEMPELKLKPFEINLRSIIGICMAHDIEIVFMTQASNWNSLDTESDKFHWMANTGESQLSEVLLDLALEKFNLVSLEVASQTETPVFDLADIIPKSLDYFYDDCHFNNNGARFTGEKLAEFIIKNKLIVLN